ncbi:MAG: AAA family ATPase [Candidatus Azobacteroides sp.]|nr:AAA family ATPase [Candidatus Azobacteroides sp.]
MKPDENNVIFRLAADFINQTSEHVFLTGKAGTGKTTFLKYIREHTYKNAIVAAPTGVAAVNAGGVTLHSLFQLPFEPYLPGVSNPLKKTFFRFSKQKIELLNQLELLIIDEVSMLRADVLDCIDETLRRIRRNTLPFGGIQVLYIGDLFQLPPVAKDEEWKLLQKYYESTFFFHARVIRQTEPVYLELKTVYRQGDPVFVDLLNRIRNNIATQDDLRELNKRYNPNFKPKEEENYIILTTHNYRSDAINRRKLEELSAEERVFSGTVDGDFPDFALPTDTELHLKTGAQVMFIRNDTEGRFVNGTIAAISRIIADQIYVYISEQNTEILVQKEVWENMRYSLNKESGKIEEEKLGSFTQYPLRLAWAITIHKSQGLTFEKAIIDAGGSFAAGQTYVALSRCTSLDGIVLFSKIHSNSILTDDYAIRFSQTEKDENELLRIFRTGKKKFWTERLLLYFDWRPMYDLLRRFDKLTEDKTAPEYEPAKLLFAGFKKKIIEWEDITIKFRQQLTQIIRQDTSEDEVISLLKIRCQKALVYFHEQFVTNILKPLQDLIAASKINKKNRTFLKNLITFEEDMLLFLENRRKVRYNNVPLAETLKLDVPKRNHSIPPKK